MLTNFKHSAYHDQQAIHEFPFARTAAARGGDIRGVQLGECCKHTVGVCDNGEKDGEVCDGAVGAAGGGDIKGVPSAGGYEHDVRVSDCCKHAVGVCDNEEKDRERLIGQLERWVEVISGDFNSQDIVKTLWTFATMGRKPVKRMMGQLERRVEGVELEGHCKDSVDIYGILHTF